MTDTWRRVGAATNDIELRAALAGTVGDETLARDLLALAGRLEEAVAPAVLLQVLELAVRSADVAGAPAALAEASRRRGALLAGLALHMDVTAETPMDLAEWRGDLEQAADILEGLRARLRDEELQLRGVADQDLVYMQLLDSALEVADLDGILRVLERAKARTLLDRVLAAPGGADELGLADRDEARALRERVVRGLSRRLIDPWAPDDVGPVAHRLATVFRRRRPPVVSTHAAATPDQLRQLATRALCCCTTSARRSGSRSRQSALTPTHQQQLWTSLPEGVRTYLEFTTVERQLRSTAHSLTELYDALIAPVGPLLEDAQRVLIVPHGVLHSVPFSGAASARRPVSDRASPCRARPERSGRVARQRTARHARDT
jgi:hypothetical protein